MKGSQDPQDDPVATIVGSPYLRLSLLTMRLRVSDYGP